MRAVDRKYHERLHATKACRQKKQPYAIAKSPRGWQSTLQIKRQHGSESAHLLFGKLVVRMGCQSRIVHARDLRMFLQKLCNGHGVLTLPLHADSKRSYTSNQ